MRPCDGIFSANFAGAWLKQQAAPHANGIFSMTGVAGSSRTFFAGARKFSRLLLDNARTPAHEKISARHEISTEAVENFWITQA
jgi:hypothetical protein